MELAGHKQNGKVVEELVPHLLPLGDVIKVLRNLLVEGVSIRDVRTILETLADSAAQVKDAGELTELVRQRLARQITRSHVGDSGELRALVLEPRAEELFQRPAAARRRSPGADQAGRQPGEGRPQLGRARRDGAPGRRPRGPPSGLRRWPSATCPAWSS